MCSSERGLKRIEEGEKAMFCLSCSLDGSGPHGGSLGLMLRARETKKDEDDWVQTLPGLFCKARQL